MIAVDAATGALVWATKLDDHPAALVTMASTVADGFVYTGTSSMEEARAAAFNYSCCSFRGSLVKMSLATGAVQWKTYAAPANLGWSGASVWGSMPSIDKARGLIYIGTGGACSFFVFVFVRVRALAPRFSPPRQL